MTAPGPDAGEERRQEADDEWLAEHRSGVMAWLRRHFKVFGGVANAVSFADTGPYAGAPRDPNLKTDEGEQSVVLHTAAHVAYIATGAGGDRCDTCGEPLTGIEHRVGDVAAIPVGQVRRCGACSPESWQRRSQMPSATRARARSRRNVV